VGWAQAKEKAKKMGFVREEKWEKEGKKCAKGDNLWFMRLLA
jgi:hypothetical protein